MLRPKFLVPVGFRSAWRNLRPGGGDGVHQVRRYASRCERICPTASKKDDCPKPCPRQPKQVCPRPSYSINPFARGCSGAEPHEARRSCEPKPNKQKTSCNVPSALHPKYSCSNAPPHAAEVFRRTFAEVRDEALDMQIFARVAANNVIEPMIERNRLRAAEEADQLNRLLRSLRQKLDDLVALSLTCGSREQAKFYRMSEKMHGELQKWSCENASGENCVRCRLQQLECTVKERTDMAVDILRTCNRSVTPNSLLLCVNLTKKDAKCILERINDTIKREINAVEDLRTEFFLEADRVLIQLKKQMELEIKQFSNHLTVCIKELKKFARKESCP